MNREEAITHLEVLKSECGLTFDKESLDMAISALSAEGETKNYKFYYDHGYKQAERDMLKKLVKGKYIKKKDVIETINNLTPYCDGDAEFYERVKCKEIIEKLSDLPTYSFPDYDKLMTINQQLAFENEELREMLDTFPDREKGTDLISRADTLKKICGKKCGCEFDECGFTEPCTYCQIINDMPSADREKGEWIEKEGWDGDVYYECSVCNEPWCTIEGTPWDNGMNFCPNCGVKMRKEEK